MLFRDILIALFILCLNMLILAQMRTLTASRSKMSRLGMQNATVLTDNTNNNILTNEKAVKAEAPATLTTALPVSSRLLAVALKAQRRVSVMIVFTGLNYIFGHIMNIPNIIANTIISKQVIQSGQAMTWNVIIFSANTLISVAYATPFLSYYIFNTHFKKFTNANVIFMFSPVLRLILVVRSKASTTVKHSSITTSEITTTQSAQ
jgi:hypothetical protein